MRNLCVRAAIVLALSLGAAGCVVYDPYYPSPSTFERSWNAALGAMQDAGVAVGNSDRAAGVIYGKKDGSAVTMNVRTQADGSVRVEINARGGPNDNAIANYVNQAYERRMGR